MDRPGPRQWVSQRLNCLNALNPLEDFKASSSTLVAKWGIHCSAKRESRETREDAIAVDREKILVT